MQQWVKMEGSGGCRSGPGSKQGRVEGSMWDRVEGEGTRVDGRGRDYMDRVASEKGGRVARDDRVSEMGQGDRGEMGLGDVMDLGQGLRVRVRVNADGGGGSRGMMLQDGMLNGCDGGCRGCGWLLNMDGLQGWCGWS